ncbi:type IV pili methyl-accepting chemotaxis transducer N-terminal domain-containing protein [Polaromonas sp. P1-6]|nr:type IV pili methyl-accepting chemotaxis transducer N-terminal domain-containing protein [Polaromonas sp. P1-6]
MSAVLPVNTRIAKAAAVPGTRLSARGKRISFGKYRELIVAVAFFLLFDLGVLILNFYTSFQIAEDALGVNLSGRQRMLSQRTAKALLSVDSARQSLANREGRRGAKKRGAAIRRVAQGVSGRRHRAGRRRQAGCSARRQKQQGGRNPEEGAGHLDPLPGEAGARARRARPASWNCRLRWSTPRPTTSNCWR